MMRRTAAALALLALTACGSESEGNGVATLSGAKGSATPTASADPEEAFRAFARCMREHGVDMPDPGAGGDVVLAPSGAPRQMGEAERACNHHLKAVLREGPKMNDPEMQDRALRFARCMRENGVDMPDPGADGSIRKKAGDGGAVERPFDPNDPAFKKAHEACVHHLGDIEVVG